MENKAGQYTEEWLVERSEPREDGIPPTVIGDTRWNELAWVRAVGNHVAVETPGETPGEVADRSFFPGVEIGEHSRVLERVNQIREMESEEKKKPWRDRA